MKVVRSSRAGLGKTTYIRKILVKNRKIVEFPLNGSVNFKELGNRLEKFYDSLDG